MLTAVGELLRGRWETSGGSLAGVEVLTRVAGWRPGALPRIPDGDPAATFPPQHANYRLRFTPVDVLERSSHWLNRPEQPFSRFITLSLFGYLTEPGVGAAELAVRADTLRSRFATVLELARPLVAVNLKTYCGVHSRDLTEHFKFSEVPLRGLPIADRLVELLERDTMIDPTTVTRFENSIIDGTESHTTRVDVFGSYAPASPLVFTSLLKPISARWAAARQESPREEFWRWRRSRRLPAALPISAAARQATIGGFFVGRLTGMIRLPGESYGSAVETFDELAGTWREFPDPLLTPTSRQRHQLDMLPALLESILLAMADCGVDSSSLLVRAALIRPEAALQHVRARHRPSLRRARGGHRRAQG